MSFLSGLFHSGQRLDLSDFTDWHSHILPGVDDGVSTLDESLAILDSYEQAGIKTLWLTPHIMEDIPNTTAGLKERFELLSENYTGNIKLNLASENMIDNLFIRRLEEEDFLPIGEDGKTLLVETSYFNAPLGFTDTIEAITAKGYTPLLAHPERYNYINSIDQYRRLKELGIEFQLNLLALCGHYGPVVKEKAMQMLHEGMYDRVGSDIHRQQHLDILTGMKLPKDTISKLNPVLNQS